MSEPPSQYQRNTYRGRGRGGRGFYRGRGYWKQRNQPNNTVHNNEPIIDHSTDNLYNNTNGHSNVHIQHNNDTLTDVTNNISPHHANNNQHKRPRRRRRKPNLNNTNNTNNNNTIDQISPSHNISHDTLPQQHKHSPALAHKKRHSSRYNSNQLNSTDIQHTINTTTDSNNLINEIDKLKHTVSQLQAELLLYRSPHIPQHTQPLLIIQQTRSSSDPHLSATKTVLTNNNTLLTTTYAQLLPPPLINHQPTPDFYDAVNSGASSSSEDFSDHESENADSEYNSQSSDTDNEQSQHSEPQQSDNDNEVNDNSDVDGEADESLHSSVLSFSDSQVPKDGLSSAVTSDNDAIFDHNDGDNAEAEDDEPDDGSDDNNETEMSPHQHTFRSPIKRIQAWQSNRANINKQLDENILTLPEQNADTAMLDNVMRAFGRANINTSVQSVDTQQTDDNDTVDEEDTESHAVGSVDDSEINVDMDDSNDTVQQRMASPTIFIDDTYEHKPHTYNNKPNHHKRFLTQQSIDFNDSQAESQMDNEVESQHSKPDTNDNDDNVTHSHSNSQHSSTHTSTVSTVSSWCDKFPFEQNIFILSRLYEFINRVYSCKDAVTYRAISKTTNKLVCIKLADNYNINSTYDPKEVRLLSRSQGHARICVLEAWHPIPSTQCYAIVMEWVNSTPVEKVLFGNLFKIRQYMYDLLCGLQYMHQRGVLYRDIKPSNVLWDDNISHATYIDYDVGTFYDPEHLHRSIVGTDGYMAPELVAIDHARQEHRKSPFDGYGLPVDLYSAGIVFGSLLFHINEDEIADLNNHNAKGDAIVARVLLDHTDSVNAELSNAYNLLLRLLDPDPESRINVDDALQHEYFTVEGDYLLR